MWIPSMGWEDPLEKEMTTHSSILVWEILWTEGPGRLHPNAIKSCAQPASAAAAAAFADKYMDTAGPAAEEFSSRAKEFAFYHQGYAPGPYHHHQPVPGYLDMPVVPGLGGPGESRHEPLGLPMESYQPWALPNGWNGQMYCPKEQAQPPHLWKSTLPGKWRPLLSPGPPVPPQLLLRSLLGHPRAPLLSPWPVLVVLHHWEPDPGRLALPSLPWSWAGPGSPWVRDGWEEARAYPRWLPSPSALRPRQPLTWTLRMGN